MKSIHEHKLGVQNHIDNNNAIMRDEDLIGIEKGVMTAGNIHAKNPKDDVKKKIDKMFDPETEENTDDLKKKKGLKKGQQMVIEAADKLSKGAKMPVGTVSNGRKKIAEGKWVDEKKSGGKKPAASEKKNMADADGKPMTVGAQRQHKEIVAEYKKSDDKKKYIDRMKAAVTKLESSGNSNSSVYGKDLATAGKKFVKETKVPEETKPFKSAADSMKDSVSGKSESERISIATKKLKSMGLTGMKDIDENSGMTKILSKTYSLTAKQVVSIVGKKTK